MEVFNITIQNTDTPAIQEIIRKLDNDRDILMTAGSLSDDSVIEVQYIKPMNQILNIGTLPKEFVDEVKSKYGTNVLIDIVSFDITLENGIYGIDASIEVEKLPESDESDVQDEANLPLPMLIIVGLLTGILTIILIIVKLIYKDKK